MGRNEEKEWEIEREGMGGRKSRDGRKKEMAWQRHYIIK